MSETNSLNPEPVFLTTGNKPAFKRLEAAGFCRVSPSTFHRIGPPADVAIGRICLWTIQTLLEWLKDPSQFKLSKTKAQKPNKQKKVKTKQAKSVKARL